MTGCKSNDSDKSKETSANNTMTQAQKETGTNTIATSSVVKNISGELTAEDLTNYPVSNAEDFKVKKVEGGVGISNYRGNDKVVVIPEEIDGQKVVEVLDDAFKYEDKITGVVISKNITKIGKRAFNGCTYLETILFQGNIVSIDTEAFYVADLRRVELPNSITVIGEKAFFNNNNITQINVPSGLTEIDNYVYAGNKITEITIPENIKTIKLYAFYDCKSLKKIKVEGKDTEFEDGSFADLPNVTIIAPEGSKAYQYAVAKGLKVEAK